MKHRRRTVSLTWGRTILTLSLTFGTVFGDDAGVAVKTMAVGNNPESVCRGFDNKLFISMINGDVPGDGTIAVVEGDLVREFATGLNAPKGLAFTGEYLITADETTVWKIDRTGRVSPLAVAADFPEPIEFLNDVAVSSDGKSIYVSEMSSPAPMFDPSAERTLWSPESEQAKSLPAKGCVYRITTEGKITVAMPKGDPALRFPNGVAVWQQDGVDQVFAADFFTGNIVRYVNGQYEITGRGPRGLDGLTVTDTAYYGSSWTEGVVWRIDRQTGKHTVLIDGLKTAADFLLDTEHRQLLVPDMVSGTLTFLPLTQ